MITYGHRYGQNKRFEDLKHSPFPVIYLLDNFGLQLEPFAYDAYLYPIQSKHLGYANHQMNDCSLIQWKNKDSETDMES